MIRLFLVGLFAVVVSAAAHAQNSASTAIDEVLNNAPISSISGDNSAVGKSFRPINGLPAVSVKTNTDGTKDYTITLQILMLMTAMTFLPAMLMMMTSFTRIIIVFSILRQALGLQQSPSNQILIGLALFLTFFIMSPVLETVNERALQPYINEQLNAREAFELAKAPVHAFMLANTRESDIDLFFRIGNLPPVDVPESIPFNVLMPAFVTSELKTAFQIGFMIFIPFLVIDIVVASVLMAMGMMMLSPLIISLPFKIMLFVLVDGWALIIGTLAASFGI
ncbi:MAG: flagellar biosynthetic protein FliP [Alteromonadaceae bacterium]|nr:MAG: flagellar biosynthetic protein FliP [Alteromonadaceae bacterium]